MDGVYAWEDSTVSVGGNVNAYDVGVGASGGSSVNVGTTDESGTFTGGNVSGVNTGVRAEGGSSVTAKTVTTNGKYGHGVEADGTGTKVTVSDSVTGGKEYNDDDKSYGIGVKADGGSTVTVGTTDESGTFTGGEVSGYTGIEAVWTPRLSASDSTSTGASPQTTVKSGSVSGVGNAIDVRNINGNVAVIVAGDVNADGYGISIALRAYDDSTSINTGVAVSGNVTAGKSGLRMGIADPENTDDPHILGNKNIKTDVVIGGTLSGQNPVELGEVFTSNETYSNKPHYFGEDDNITLTVWRIQRNNADGKEVPYGKDEYIVSEAFDPTIRYIIRVEQPEEGATLTVKRKKGDEEPVVELGDIPVVKNADGKTVAIDGVGTANEGDLILVIAEVKEGYEVTVYGSDGTTQPLAYDSTTNTWSMPMPKGGGVLIWADVKLKQFTISFFNEKGDTTPLWSGSFPYGKTPAYGGETTPTKEADARFTYSWNNKWTPELTAAKADASYYAVFTPEAISYKVTFDAGDGTLVASDGASSGGTYEYGDEITLPGATRDGYTLEKWEDADRNTYEQGANVDVTGNKTFTAVWKQNDTATNQNPSEKQTETDQNQGNNGDQNNNNNENQNNNENNNSNENQNNNENNNSNENQNNNENNNSNENQNNNENQNQNENQNNNENQNQNENNNENRNPDSFLFPTGDNPPTPPASQVGSGMNAFELYMQNIVEEIKNAEENGVLIIDVRKTGWTSLKRDIFEAAAERSDLTIILYTYQGADYSVTIPAGTDLSPVIASAIYLETHKIGPALDITPEPYTD